nr:VanZ family protein [Bacilli bacterium]
MKKLSVILVIIWMIVIFMFSSYNGNISSMQSDGIVVMLARLIHYTGDIDILRVIVRKMAHFTEYLILGILVINACKYNSIKDMIKLSILICILYACTDEIHQLFIQGRGGRIFDVLIDTLGSLTGIFTYKVLRK